LTLAFAVAPGLEKLLALVGAQIGRSGAVVGPDSLAADMVGWNSMAMVNILFAVEDAYGVEFTSEQMERVDGVPSLVDILAEAGGVLALN
jgi:acyl carrier protein